MTRINTSHIAHHLLAPIALLPGSLVAAARRGSPWWIAIVAFTLALMGARTVQGQTTIVLRSSASVMGAGGGAGGETVALADVADLTGSDAEALGKTVLIADLEAARAAATQGWTSITVADVRAALEARPEGVHWGRIALSGSTCTLRIAAARAVESRARTSPGANAQPHNPPQPVDVSGRPTMRSAIALRIAELYNVVPDDLRLAFENTDDEYLATPVAGTRIDIQPSAAPSAARIPINIVVYDGDRVRDSRVISVQALLYRSVITTTAPIQRQQMITAEMVVEGKQWLPPTSKTSVSIEQSIGAVAARRISAGEMLDLDDITAPFVAKRGDTVYVHVLSGPVTLKAKGRAMGNARDGELVQVKLEGTDQMLTARMSGRGRAVMVVDTSAPVSPSSSPSSSAPSAAPGVADPSPAPRAASARRAQK